MSRFVILFEKNSPSAQGTWYSVANTISWAAYHLYIISSLLWLLGSIQAGLRCERAQQDQNVQRKILYAKSKKRQALKLPICNDFSRLVCRYEALRHKTVASQLPCWCCTFDSQKCYLQRRIQSKTPAGRSQKCYFGEGIGHFRAQKSVGSEQATFSTGRFWALLTFWEGAWINMLKTGRTFKTCLGIHFNTKPLNVAGKIFISIST